MSNSNLVIETPSIQVLIDVLNANERKIKIYRQKAEEATYLIFGKNRKLFNPIYVSNICLADCPYCGYRVSNKKLKRKTLNAQQSVQEALHLKQRGIENLLLLAGDYRHDKYLEMLIANIKAVKLDVNPKWLGIEVATLETEEYKLLKEAGAESVTVFQETYNRQRYNTLHTNLEYKGDFDFRYNAQERAYQGGIKEVGFGILYGVGFWKEDTIAMAEQALYLKKKYPDIKLRFSFPRLQMSVGQDVNSQTEVVTDVQLLRCIVGIRLLFPDANLVLTGRENLDFLMDKLAVVNIMGYAGSTVVGGYTLEKNGLPQFDFNNNKKTKLEELLKLVSKKEFYVE